MDVYFGLQANVPITGGAYKRQFTVSQRTKYALIKSYLFQSGEKCRV